MVNRRSIAASLAGMLCLAGALLVSACAHYTSQPLAERPAALAAPADAVLAERAGAILRPWLPARKVDLSAPLTGEAIAALAVVNNPDLAAQRVAAGVADAQVFAAGLLPDPSFSLGADKILSGPDTFTNIAGALGLDLNALRTRAVTRAAAVAQARQVRLDLAWAEWQTAGAARLQAVRIDWLTRIVALDRTSDADAQLLLQRTSAAAARGDLAASAAEAQRVAAYDASERLRLAEQELLSARHQLNALLGLPPDTALALAPGDRPPAPLDAERLFALAEKDRPDLAALRAGYDAQEAAVHKAVLDQFPSLGLTINAARDATNNRTLGPAIDFTLPLWNRNRGGIAVERATRAALKAEYDARLFSARADIAEGVAAMALTRRQLDRAQAGLPTLDRQASAARAAAVRGDTSLASAIALEQQARDRREQVAQGEQALREQEIALELLVGAPREAWGQK
ncbi:MAG: TolC family protein [Sphingomonadales bacterium]|nr:TolC family protein [Sphingomonadales bacterium]MDE2568575.1 TolC family protein [Sphingomonadales bacterium]